MIWDLLIGCQPKCVIRSILASAAKHKGKTFLICEFGLLSTTYSRLSSSTMAVCLRASTGSSEEHIPSCLSLIPLETLGKGMHQCHFFWIEISLVWAVPLKQNYVILSVYAIGRHSAYPRFFSWGRRSKMLAMSLATCSGY